MEDDRAARFKTLIRVSPDKAYAALTTSEALDMWFTTSSTVDARAGGNIMFRWENWGVDEYTGELGGPVLEAEPGERFVFRWPADSRGYETTVEVDFKRHPQGTVVSLRERGYIDGPVGTQDLMNRQAGWAEVLTLMKFYLEHGVVY